MKPANTCVCGCFSHIISGIRPQLAMGIIYLVLTGCLYIISLPIQAVIAVVILCGTGMPVFFAQQRVGKSGKRFIMYKFRTMVNGADQLQKQHQGHNESKGPVFKIHNDPRFTGIGKFLSHTGLDELPQLINVLRGEMSLIGPRPLPLLEAKKLKPWMRARERVLPGIISPAILTGSYHTDFEAWMRHDVAYVKEKNPIGDIGLFLQSIPFMFRLFLRCVR